MSFTRLRARPYPRDPAEKLRTALVAYGVDPEQLAREDDSGRASLVRQSDTGEILLEYSEHESRDGIVGLRVLIAALLEAGVDVFVYADPSADEPGTVELHRVGHPAVRLSWADGEPALDEQTLLAAARDGADDQRSLAELPDVSLGAAVKRLLAPFAEAP